MFPFFTTCDRRSRVRHVRRGIDMKGGGSPTSPRVILGDPGGPCTRGKAFTKIGRMDWVIRVMRARGAKHSPK